MKVLSVAYPLLPAGPNAAGGAEQILSLVERGIVCSGHESAIVAAAGSVVEGELFPTPVPDGEITDDLREEAQVAHHALIEKVLSRNHVDLVHFHGLDFHRYVPDTRVPMLATLHLPIDWYPQEVFRLKSVVLNCVTKAQAHSQPLSTTLPVIENGIDLARYRACLSCPREYLLFIGRVCPEKGIHLALEAAHQLDWPIFIVGPVHPFESHQQYFRQQVQPLLDSKRRYVGPIGLDEKVQLLSKARCLLIPSLVAETSSLVAMEAASCGTPVVALRSGALPEIVEHAKTGFIVDSADELVRSIKQIDSIDPAVCRAEAERRFDAERMVQEYLDLYKSLTKRRAVSD
jgi:glycosyltransferase involved in cell wall biosynthesis